MSECFLTNNKGVGSHSLEVLHIPPTSPLFDTNVEYKLSDYSSGTPVVCVIVGGARSSNVASWKTYIINLDNMSGRWHNRQIGNSGDNNGGSILDGEALPYDLSTAKSTQCTIELEYNKATKTIKLISAAGGYFNMHIGFASA